MVTDDLLRTKTSYVSLTSYNKSKLVNSWLYSEYVSYVCIFWWVLFWNTCHLRLCYENFYELKIIFPYIGFSFDSFGKWDFIKRAFTFGVSVYKSRFCIHGKYLTCDSNVLWSYSLTRWRNGCWTKHVKRIFHRLSTWLLLPPSHVQQCSHIRQVRVM